MSNNAHAIHLDLLPDEYWWGGAVADGWKMPFAEGSERDLTNLSENQGMPLLISSKGRYVWSEKAYRFAFDENQLHITSQPDVTERGEDLGSLRDVYRHVSAKYFPTTGTHPDMLLFSAPQYNTWIEMMYQPTQAKVLHYAEMILSHGLPPGVLIIDANWADDVGQWVFHPGRFPAPEQMVESLHRLGFKVMLWLCPFISPDSVTFREVQHKGYLLRDKHGLTAIRKWWDGHSAVLDCTNDEAVAWLHERLDRLVSEIGVDGFKFDGGDPNYYLPTDLSSKPTDPCGHCEAWARVGLKYSLNEYRACWKCGGQPIVQRLSDKNHAWTVNGLAGLIPNGLAQGLMGYPYNCPDMIGGGQFVDFINPEVRLDAELFVRYAQCAALFPMMQFSAAPWRILDKQHTRYCIEAAHLRAQLSTRFELLVEQAAQSGEPIMRHLAYTYPDGCYERVSDQFMLGDAILVAPILQRGQESRLVQFPPGAWIGDDGALVNGPTVQEIQAPLSRLPWYIREDSQDSTAPTDRSSNIIDRLPSV
ncbi:MAG TPA: glycoside hydrolase family 31 protein [Aggregatilineales bacterium]|nr:glycoside hydrolase family 31 protein [Aggregatilineales bacterium]